MCNHRFFIKYSSVISIGFILFHFSSSVYAESVDSKSKPVVQPSQQSETKYTDHGNGTVTDNKTGLMWKKCAEGKKGIKCTGDDVGYTYDEMVEEFARTVSFAGYDDWYVPSIEELRTLVWCSNGVDVTKQNINAIRMSSGCGVAPKRKGGQTKRQREAGAGNFKKPTISIKIFPNGDKESKYTEDASYSNYYSIYNFWSGSYTYHRTDLSKSFPDPFYVNFLHGLVEKGGSHRPYQVRFVRKPQKK